MAQYSQFELDKEDKGFESTCAQQGIVVWFTGLSGAGKSTLANLLKKSLDDQGRMSVILDGDTLRMGLNHDLGYSDADRKESIRRASEVAKLLMDVGMIVIIALISPFAHDRALAKARIGRTRFLEVYVDTPLAICEQRDPKGLYRSTRLGITKKMTGIDSPYEPPKTPDCVIKGAQPLEVSIQQLLDHLPL